MRRLNRLMHRDDRGAIATVVVILLAGGVLLGMAALTVDVGRLYSERRELQNGADAGALAVAQDCAKGLPCDAGTGAGSLAGTYANQNSKDGASNVNRVCGRGASTLTGCPAPSSSIYDCPASPDAAVKYVEVKTTTRTSGGSTLLPPAFARALLGNGSYNGTTVSACARAGWGAPKSINAFPVTFSLCEWNSFTGSGTNYAPPPPYTAGYPTSYEHKVLLHTTAGAGSCPSGPSGADLPGGFGWLDSTGCQATVDENGWVDTSTGNSIPSDCRDVIEPTVGNIIYIPVYDDLTGTGNNIQYHVKGFAAFYLTGYSAPSAKPKSTPSIATGATCKSNETCLIGWFTQGLVPVGTTGGSGPPMGATVISLIG